MEKIISLEIASWIKFIINRARPIIEQLIDFHDHIIFLLSITTIVTMIITTILKNKKSNNLLTERQAIKTIWTTIPAIILVFIGNSIIKILYLIEKIIKPSIAIKTIGNQWYWSYEYSDFKKLEFDNKPQKI